MTAEQDRLSWPGRIVLGAVLALLALLTLRQVGSLDAGFHLRAGNWILAGHGWPRLDPFTYTVTDRPYVDMSWGYQVLLALAERLAGAPGMVLLQVALVLVIFALVLLTARLVRADSTSLLLFPLLGVLAAEMRYEVRPELLSYAFLALVLYLLQRHAEGRKSPLWLLPVVFLVWANCHSLFILGWAALGCFAAGTWLRDRRLDRRLTGWAAASVAVTLLNPYGFEGVLFPFTLGTRLESGNVFAQGIGEFQSPFHLPVTAMRPFHPWVPISAFTLLFVAVLLSLPSLLKQRRFQGALLALPFLYLSAGMVRNIPLLVVACLPGAIWGLPLGRLLQRVAPRRLPGRVLRQGMMLVVLLVTVVLGLRVSTDAYYLATRRADRFGLGWNRETLPLAAAEYLNDAGLEGRGLNHLNFGGYLMWARPEPVFIDGRLEVIGEKFYGYYRNVLSSESALEAAVRRYDIGWVVFPFKIERSLLQALSGSVRWRLVYYDALAAVFVRADRFSPGLVHDSVVQLAGPPPELDLAGLPGIDSPRPGRFRRALSGTVRRQSYPTEPFGRGLFLYFRRTPRRAAPLFADAVRRSGGRYYELYHNLGAALFRLGYDREARACYRIVLDEAPQNETARERLRQIEQRLGP